jgi:hypothetical protein
MDIAKDQPIEFFPAALLEGRRQAISREW